MYEISTKVMLLQGCILRADIKLDYDDEKPSITQT